SNAGARRLVVPEAPASEFLGEELLFAWLVLRFGSQLFQTPELGRRVGIGANLPELEEWTPRVPDARFLPFVKAFQRIGDSHVIDARRFVEAGFEKTRHALEICAGEHESNLAL